jgi:hypothetical protein
MSGLGAVGVQGSSVLIDSYARVAVYDDLLSSPRIITIEPAPIVDFIEQIALRSYEEARNLGGRLPYTVIREVAENFIHAGFKECLVSVLDDGNVVRFSDQGPGIGKKNLVLLPGYSSATAEMKKFIRGVGSGFPIVHEYLGRSGGRLTIDDNIDAGVVITLFAHQDDDRFEYGASARQAQPYAADHTRHAFAQPPVEAGARQQDAADPGHGRGLRELPLSARADSARGWLPDTLLEQAFVEGAGMRPHDGSSQPGSSGFNAAADYMAAGGGGSGVVEGPYGGRPGLNLRPAAAASRAGAFALESGSLLKAREHQALRLLYENGMLGSGDLAVLLDVSPPTATRLLQRLEEAGFVELARNKKRIISNSGLAYLNNRGG